MGMIYDCSSDRTRKGSIDAAVQAVRAGELVVMPTDTLYGIGADAFNNQAVAHLLAAKHRGTDYPVPVLVGGWDTIQGLVARYTGQMKNVVEAFWPGGVSVVVPQAPSLPWNLGDTKGTVMLRMPLHPVALQLLSTVGPMAVSSANIHGHQAPTTAFKAKQQLEDSVSVYLDGGVAPVGKPSTIVDLSGPVPRLLREGAVSANRIAEVLEMPAESLREAG